MSTESLLKLKSLFIEASALPAGDRGAFLEAQCAGDPALRERVEALLAAHDGAGEYLAEPTLGGGAVQGLGGEGPGAMIGEYKLLELIGEGGFGLVYMAEQRHPVRRRVALKVIKQGMDTRQVIARFEQERQALAMMDHPNIAKVLDAGATESGRPYFVMELVRGEPITTYADARQLSIPERLELFQEVCHAVQHAHQKGIIHRDLKPSNILVAEIDGKPTPRIIDFGIAKATAGAGVQLTDKTVFTEFRQFIGTPEYMSPEQAGKDAADIDTRSDIYSLGVLLYALLTGGPPFDPKRLRSAAWEEMRRIIREDEPELPSTRLHSRQDTSEIAASRQTESSRLIGQIRGDLDWIAMKCLEKERARRYETANALALDIARHLHGEPVAAAPPSAGYRIRKFVRRNRASVTAGALIGVVGLLGLVGTSAALFVARAQRDRALDAEKRAEEFAEAQKELRRSAEDLARRAEVRADILRWGLGSRPGGGENLEMRDVLELAEKYSKAYTGRTAVAAAVYLSQMWLHIDESQRAETQARRAVLLMEASRDNFDPREMFEARSVLIKSAGAGVSRDLLINDRLLAVDATVEYLRGINEDLGDAAARFAAGVLWQRPSGQEEARRAAQAGADVIKAADSLTEMTPGVLFAVTRAMILPCLEGMGRLQAKECAPILGSWVERAERHRLNELDEMEMLELRHTALKLYVKARQFEDAAPMAREQLEATDRALPRDSKGRMRWQRIRFDACAAYALLRAPDADEAEARGRLVELGRIACATERTNGLAAGVAARHLYDATTPEDRSLLVEALGPIDLAFFEVSRNPSPLYDPQEIEAENVRRAGDLFSAQSVQNPGARRLLGAAWISVIRDFHALWPDGFYVVERFAEFTKPPPGEKETALHAQAQLDLARCASELGDWERARGLYESAVACFGEAVGVDSWFAEKGRFFIGDCRVMLGERDEGLSVMRESRRKMSGMLGPLSPVTLSLECELYARLLECGLRAEAEESLERLLSACWASQSPGRHSILPLLRMAAIGGEVSEGTLQEILELVQDLTRRSKRYLPSLNTPERVRNDFLIPELVILMKLNRRAAAAELARGRLSGVLSIEKPHWNGLVAEAGGVLRVQGLGAEVYDDAEKCCDKLTSTVSPVIEWHRAQLRSLVHLRHDRFDRAIDEAVASDAEWIEKTGRGLPDSAAVRAIAHARLGHWDEARTNLENARRWARDRVYATPLIPEAEALIGNR